MIGKLFLVKAQDSPAVACGLGTSCSFIHSPGGLLAFYCLGLLACPVSQKVDQCGDLEGTVLPMATGFTLLKWGPQSLG